MPSCTDITNYSDHCNDHNKICQEGNLKHVDKYPTPVHAPRWETTISYHEEKPRTIYTTRAVPAGVNNTDTPQAGTGVTGR